MKKSNPWRDSGERTASGHIIYQLEREPGRGWLYARTSRRDFCVSGNQSAETMLEPGEMVWDVSPVDPADLVPAHPCPVADFLEDPITEAYGLGGDMDEWSRLLRCPVCDGEGE